MIDELEDNIDGNLDVNDEWNAYHVNARSSWRHSHQILPPM